MRDFNFQKTSGEPIGDLVQYIKDCINEDKLTSEFHIFIGCDSLPNRYNKATYSVVVCLYRVGRGAHVVYSRESGVRIYGKTRAERLKNRLWDEVYRVVDLATLLTDSDLLNDQRITDFQVHLDVNPNETFDSNVIHREAIGYINSLGFDAYAKPDSPAASYVSDHLCRGKEDKMAGKHLRF